MKRFPTVILALVVSVSASWSADDDGKKKPDPKYRAEIAKLRNKLGGDFTVWRVGVFVVASDLPEGRRERYDKLITQLEGALYAKLFTRRPSAILKIALFKDNASLRKSAKKLAVKSAVMPGGGFFMPYEKVICADTAMGEWVVKHEVTHALLHADFRQRRLTPWIDEGIAMLAESCVLTDDDMTFRMDWRTTLVQRYARARRLPKLRDVLKMDFRTYNSRKNRMICDALARSLLMYLHEKGQLITFYKRYRKGYKRDKTGRTYLEETLQKNIDAIETDVLAWVEKKGARRTQPKPARLPARGE